MGSLWRGGIMELYAECLYETIIRTFTVDLYSSPVQESCPGILP